MGRKDKVGREVRKPKQGKKPKGASGATPRGRATPPTIREVNRGEPTK